MERKVVINLGLAKTTVVCERDAIPEVTQRSESCREDVSCGRNSESFTHGGQLK
jgi:hypothetical protein